MLLNTSIKRQEITIIINFGMIMLLYKLYQKEHIVKTIELLYSTIKTSLVTSESPSVPVRICTHISYHFKTNKFGPNSWNRRKLLAKLKDKDGDI